ncbi:hypothetical protein FDO65_19490 [Nakamurella flava]|uniref:Uncharacterized protein n=1 Tax=Nakamurella flava TaxID=2576308 RepID=A0A4U6QAM3_9ACTN|nr:hypothetical protein [Nakamurella flava]TKV57003.1 hypothetical protein FDO65_19490 [Nakamurella flava]
MLGQWLLYSPEVRSAEQALMGGHFPHSGTDLFADDLATSPEQISHRITSRIDVAADHIESLRLNIFQEEQMAPPYAMFSLLRGAVESAATACWLAFPADAVTRRLRALRVAHHEAKDHETYVHHQMERNPNLPQPEGSPPTTAPKRLLEALQFNPAKNKLTYVEIMKDVDKEIQIVPGRAWWWEIENCWRLCSAMAHGRRWAQSTVLKMEIVSEPEQTQSVTARFTPSAQWLAWAIVHAVGMMDLALYRAQELGTRRDGQESTT